MRIVLLSFVFSCLFISSGWADSAKPEIQYVGSISINPSQDAKALADWYTKLGVETSLYGDGGYYGLLKTPGGDFFFGIHAKADGAPKQSSRSVSVVFRVSDYKAYVSMVEKNGLKAESTETDATGSFAHYRDPDGNDMTVWGN